MGRSGEVTRAIVAALAVLLGTRCLAADGPSLSLARATVERFASEDEAGNQCRYRFAKWTPLPERSGTPDGTFEATSDPFVIVTGCRVDSVEVTGRRGTASLVCSRIGSSPGDAVVHAASGAEPEVLRLRLRYEAKAWWVIDPPPPRIRVGALVEAFERYVKAAPPLPEADAALPSYRIQKAIEQGLDTLRRIQAGLQGSGLP